ncbi:MAG: CoA transferase [Proteobacteria bacterium]|nr:CoA transferase [Pseudomonadota bacterium]
MPGPLEGIKVLSFGRFLSGPYAAMMLGDMGAEVVKVETPKLGDFARFAGPHRDGISSYFLSINRGKKSVTLNLKADRARKIVGRLAGKADILLENFRPGVMDKLGLGYGTLHRQNPRLIYASISGFGYTGPYSKRPAVDMIAQGMGGLVSITGEPDRPPVRAGYSIGDLGASLFASTAVLAALHERSRSGEGQWIDISMMDCQVALCENACARYFATGEVPGPVGSRHPLFTPFQVFPTLDGYIVLIAMEDGQWKTFCRAAGREGWIKDEFFGTNEARLTHYDQFLDEMNALMRTRSTREWTDLLDARGLMCGPVNNIEQVVRDPHVQARDMIVEVEHDRAGRLKVVGTPMKFSRTPCRIDRACPDLGAHTDEILKSWLDLSDDDLNGLRDEGVV